MYCPLVCRVLVLAVAVVRCQLSVSEDSSSYDDCVCPGNDFSRRCQCVYIRLCNASTNYITTGTDYIIRWRMGGTLKSRCGRGEKCCFVPEDEDSTTSATITTEVPLNTELPGLPSRTFDLPPENTKGGCGVRRIFTKNRIFSDDPSTSFGQFPWMVAVYNYTRGRLELNCGGSLISHEVVLTAAHCVHNRRNTEVIVRAGDWDIKNKDEPEKYVDRLVKEIIVHEDFYPASLVNDVALLVLSSPLPRKIHIDTICLPEEGVNSAGKRCIVTGWGSRRGGREDYDTRLSQVEIPVVHHKKCQDTLRKTVLGRYFQLHRSFMCAGGEEEYGACLLDGGGPLICESERDPDRYYQAGIVAGGLACGLKNIPDLYTNISYFRDWIMNELEERNLESEAIHP